MRRGGRLTGVWRFAERNGACLFAFNSDSLQENVFLFTESARVWRGTNRDREWKKQTDLFFNENGHVAVASQRELLCAYAPWSLETSLGSLGMSHISGMFQILSPSVATGSYIGCLANFKPYCNETTAVADATDRFNCVFTLTLCTKSMCTLWLYSTQLPVFPCRVASRYALLCLIS